MTVSGWVVEFRINIENQIFKLVKLAQEPNTICSRKLESINKIRSN